MTNSEKLSSELARSYCDQKVCHLMFVLLLASKPSIKLLTYTPNGAAV